MKVSAIAAVMLCLTLVGAGGVSAQDNANRTLLGNQAVRDDLELTPEQREKLDALLAEMEQQIAKKLAAAKQAGQDEFARPQIADELVQEYGIKAQSLLDQKQQVRFWEIGAQTAGAAIFNNNRTRRVLQLTPDQMKQMEALSDKMIKNVTRLAMDPKIDVARVQAESEREQQSLFDECLALLTAEQRKDFGALLGKPFDRELLSSAAGKKPRSLTFVFSLTGQNSYGLLNDPMVREALGLTAKQREKLQTLLKEDDERLTEIRLRALKQHDADFSELGDDEKLKLATSILKDSADVVRSTNAQVQKMLTAKQAAELDRRMVKQIGVRAIGSDRIAKALKLTSAQKKAFAEANAQFDQQTAVMRVVRSVQTFDQQTFGQHQTAFDAAASAILTPDQVKKLDALKQN